MLNWGRTWRVGLVLAFLFAPGPGQAACRLALVLGIDVSASVNAEEYELQVQGTAAALLSPRVSEALLEGGDPVALSAFFWSGAAEHWVISDWVVVDSAAVLDRFAARIAGTPRPKFAGRTATGEAMVLGLSMLARAPICRRNVLDLATDGQANDGVPPILVAGQGAIINALSIGGDIPFDHGDAGEPLRPLSRWLERNVIRGDESFVEKALDHRAFERAMTRKLLRELGEMRIGAAQP